SGRASVVRIQQLQSRAAGHANRDHPAHHPHIFGLQIATDSQVSYIPTTSIRTQGSWWCDEQQCESAPLLKQGVLGAFIGNIALSTPQQNVPLKSIKF
ncbi:MAG: hypothetical protein CUN55_21195, partial [Phototrophicales bacterium]